MFTHFHITTSIVISILIFAFWRVPAVQPDTFELHEILATVQTLARIELCIKYVPYTNFSIRENVSWSVGFCVRSAVKPEGFCIDSKISLSFFDTERLRTSDRTTERRPRVRSACPPTSSSRAFPSPMPPHSPSLACRRLVVDDVSLDRRSQTDGHKPLLGQRN